MDNSEIAVQYFKEGFNCSQSVFAAFSEKSGIDKDLALRIAAGFGGGIARMQQTCGAVTGAVMAIGYVKGHTQPDAVEQKEKVYELTREFVDRFIQRHKTIKCSELLGCSLETEDGRNQAKELNLFETICSHCVRDAVEILDEMNLSDK